MGKFKESQPVPDDWTSKAWELAYNRADSRLYNAGGARTSASEKRTAAARARSSGETRALALTLASHYEDQGAPKVNAASSSQSASENLRAGQPASVATMNDNEYTYPLTGHEAQKTLDMYLADIEANKKEIRPLFVTCLGECKSNPTKCNKHKAQYTEKLKAFYTNVAGGRWATYRPVTYVAEIRKMFDDDVDLKVISERVKKELRKHNKDATCAFRFDDDAIQRKWKIEAETMYDDEKVDEAAIKAFIKGKQDEFLATRPTAEQEYLRQIAEVGHGGDDKILPIIRKHICSLRSTDSKHMTEVRAKWANLIDQGTSSWTSLYNIMNNDVADLTKAEKEQEGIRFAQIALEKEKARKAAEKQEKLAKKAEKEALRNALLHSNHSRTCVGCQKIAVPNFATGAVLKCLVCKELVIRKMQKNESYYCSEKCVYQNGQNHMEEKHPCLSGANCVNPERHGFEKFSQTCPGCWQNWGVVSYVCNLVCFDKNWVEHWTKAHPVIEKGVHERKAKEVTDAKEKEGAGRKEKGKEKDDAASVTAEAMEAHRHGEDHEMTDA